MLFFLQHGAFIGYAPPTKPWKGRKHDMCTTDYMKDIVVIDDKGILYIVTYFLVSFIRIKV